jgi:molybdenum cofactor synthesis domain-containing protein
MRRRIYLRMLSLEEAQRAFLKRFPLGGWRKEAEEVPSAEACGRITAQPVFARLSSPNYHAAAMDGVAVSAEKTFQAHVDRPLNLTLGKDAYPVNTGHPLPQGTNAVIMIEDVVEIDRDTIQIESPAYPWQHVRRVGEDIVATELLLPQNHRLSPYDLGALLGAGLPRVAVRPKPKVVLLPTGAELIAPEQLCEDNVPEAGQIIEYNSVVLAEMIRLWGGKPIRMPIAPDDNAHLRHVLDEALDEGADVVIINAGSSAGSEDHTANVIEEMGEIVAHGISMMPGKPTILGVVRDRPVIGNPGYPVSAVVSCEQIVRPLIARLLGVDLSPRPRLQARTSRKIPSRIGMEEFLRVNLGAVGERIVAIPLPRAAGSITTLTQADGILRIPMDVEGLPEGADVEVELLRSPDEIRRTLVAIGSHDLTLDLLADRMKALARGFSLASSNVGSLGGLMALRKGHAHLAGSHLLDPESGEYNTPYIKRYLRALPVKLVHLVFREQGLMVSKGNPQAIHGLEDLLRPEIVFVNRQGGSGTRILLDFHLQCQGFDSKGIQGYEREEYTHMDVAVAVLSGAAHTGMGIRAAAHALGLDFIPIARERYDLVIPEAFFETEGIQLLLEVIQSRHFREAVQVMGGYDPSESGLILTQPL